MQALSESLLAALPHGVAAPAYRRSAVRAGIAHLSVGNFHRAHQAWYIDRLLAEPSQQGWGICGIGLLDTPAERAKAAAMAGQNGLYTLSRFDAGGTATRQVVGAIVEFLYAPDDIEAVLRRLSDPAIRIVSMTITEGGYNQDRVTGRYRIDAPEVVAELAAPHRPRSAFGVIVEALRRRRDAGAGPFTAMSCDNLINNGGVTREAVVSHARALDPALADWIERHVAFPNAMVDGITPAVGPEECARIAAATGIDDRVPVFSESYMNWVMEDAFCAGRPDFERVGVRMVPDVHPYELAKLHMLNASHSMLAYPAQLAGLRCVDEALGEPQIRRLLERFMEIDVIPMLAEPPGMNLQDYKNELLARFGNPAIRDQVARISGGGAVKWPVFLAPTIRAVVARGGDVRRLAFGLACFLRYLGGIDDRGQRFEPNEPALSPADLALARDPDPAAALGMTLLHEIGVAPGGALAEAVLRMRHAIAQGGALAALARIDSI